MALISGDANPKFYIASLTEEAVVMPRVGTITAADGNKLLGVNNVNATHFFKSIGFLTDDSQAANKGLLSSIFVMHVCDEEGNCVDISRIPFNADDEGVYVGGRVVTGAVLSVAFNTKEVVLETARRLLNTVKERHGGGTVIIHSCLGRRYGLLSEPMAELDLIRDTLGSGFGYIATYANGELCPTAVKADGRASNQEHSQSLIACAL
jgi:hypothetical protein